MLTPAHVGNMMVGRRPKIDYLVGRPERATAHRTPEDIVVKLIVEQEIAVVYLRPVWIILAPHALHLEGVEHHVQAARHQPEQAEIDEIDLDDPAPVEIRATGERRLEPEPRRGGSQHEEQIPRPQVTAAEKPFQRLHGFQRPAKYGYKLWRMRRSPLTLRRTKASLRRRGNSHGTVLFHSYVRSP